jgi:hypothetical protein
MDWAKQMRDMAGAWTEMQRNLLSAWTTAAQTSPQQVNWPQLIDAWQSSVHQMLALQGECVRVWVENMPPESEAAAPAQQYLRMSQQWAAAQRELWDSWFALMRRMDPTSLAEGGGADPEATLQMWQAMVQQTIDAQAEWWQQSGKPSL